MPAGAVTCPRCGASTPAPADLTLATFPCGACGETLRTADAVGGAVAEAHGFVKQMEAALEGRGGVPEVVPRDPTALPPRTSACLRCKAPVQVSMNLRVHEVTCAACGSTQPIAAHVSDAERMQADQAHQIAENARLRELRATGTPCPQCGGHVPVGAGTAVQAVCPFCGATVALAGVVGADAVAREQLAHGVRGAIVAARAKHEASARRRDVWILAFVAAFVVLMIGGFALTSVLGALAAALR